MVDQGVSEVREREPAQTRNGVVGRHVTGAHAVDQRPQFGLVHLAIVSERPRISYPEARSLAGMTRAELVENLGTIAHSGSKAFLKALGESGAKKK